MRAFFLFAMLFFGEDTEPPFFPAQATQGTTRLCSGHNFRLGMAESLLQSFFACNAQARGFIVPPVPRYIASRHVDEDPTWRYPFASRKQIENLRIYFEHFRTRPRSWHDQSDKETRVFYPREKKNGHFVIHDSVPPHLRKRADDWFNQKIAELKAQGITPSPGKIRSLRMNRANIARNYWTGKRFADYSLYLAKKNAWLKYLAWEAQQQRTELNRQRGRTRSKLLEVA
jgi:hypothetical protein